MRVGGRGEQRPVADEPAEAGMGWRRRSGGGLRTGLILLLCALAAITLGFLAPLLIPLGVLAVLLVLFDPAELGSRLRHSPGWWGFPGLRRASRGSASFAALLAGYTIVVPGLALGGIVLVISNHRAAPLAAVPSLGGVASTPPGASFGAPALPGASPSAPSGDQPTAGTYPAGSAGASSPAAASPTPSAGPTTGASPTPTTSATPTPNPTLSPSPTATPTPGLALCGAPANPWGYDLCSDGDAPVYPPVPGAFCTYFDCVSDFGTGSGYVVECPSGRYALENDPSKQCGSPPVQPLYS